MIALYKKELSVFFSSIIGPFIVCLFLLINGLLLWTNISQFNILENSYASMNIFFTISPIIFLIFIPALSMRTFSEEFSTGTIESLITKPISVTNIIVSKFLSILTIITFSIFPTLLYPLTIYFMGESIGNLDLAGIMGSYIGLFLLSSVFASIGVFTSSLSNNQIISFILAIIISLVFYFGFDLLCTITLFHEIDFILQKIGISFHYFSISKGLILTSDIIYFLSIIYMFLKFTESIIINFNYDK